MSAPFKAEPPLPAWKGTYGGIKKHATRLFWSFAWILWQAIIPFNHRPEEPKALPEPAGDLDDAQIDLCKGIFDQAEARRSHLEQKAQWTFALIVFLVPLLASVFVFLLRDALPNTTSHILAITFVFISGSLLLLGFISVVRAISVQAREMLFLGAVIDPQSGQFRTYSKSFYARGLLYCAAMNTAMNDHIAQFVKGAHILTAGAVVALLAAAAPAGIAFSNHTSSPTQTSVVGSVDISSTDLEALREQIVGLSDAIATPKPDNFVNDRIKALEVQVKKLQAKLNAMERKISDGPTAAPGPQLDP